MSIIWKSVYNNPSYKGIIFTQFGKFSEYFMQHPQAGIHLQNETNDSKVVFFLLTVHIICLFQKKMTDAIWSRNREKTANVQILMSF